MVSCLFRRCNAIHNFSFKTISVSVSRSFTLSPLPEGTPTPSTQASDIAHFQPLLAFLHHDPYGLHPRSAWDAAVRLPFEARRPEGRERLVGLLRATMIRAVKSDLLLLPKVRGGGGGAGGKAVCATTFRAVKSDLAWLPAAGTWGTWGSATEMHFGEGEGAAVAGRALPLPALSPVPCLPLTLRPAFNSPAPGCLPF